VVEGDCDGCRQAVAPCSEVTTRDARGFYCPWPLRTCAGFWCGSGGSERPLIDGKHGGGQRDAILRRPGSGVHSKMASALVRRILDAPAPAGGGITGRRATFISGMFDEQVIEGPAQAKPASVRRWWSGSWKAATNPSPRHCATSTGGGVAGKTSCPRCLHGGRSTPVIASRQLGSSRPLFTGYRETRRVLPERGPLEPPSTSVVAGYWPGVVPCEGSSVPPSLSSEGPGGSCARLAPGRGCGGPSGGRPGGRLPSN